MNEKNLKLVGYIAVAVVLINFLLFIFTVISWQIFLVILIIAYVFNKFALPKLKDL